MPMTVQTESRKTRFLNLVREFRIVWFFFLVLALLSTIITVVSALFPFVLQLLCSSIKTPWGIVTGIFVHSLDEHLFGNLITIAAYFFMFMYLSVSFSFEAKPAKAKSLVIIVFATAVFANIVSLILVPQVKSIGASGIGFAILGVIFAESFKNVSLAIHSLVYLHTPVSPNFFISNLFVFIFLVFGLFLSPTAFFIIAPGVNFFVHMYSFFLGDLCYLTYSLYQNKDVIMNNKTTPQS